MSSMSATASSAGCSDTNRSWIIFAKALVFALGGTTEDGLFTLLPVGCIGYCDHAPAMLINGKLYGPLTPRDPSMKSFNN